MNQFAIYCASRVTMLSLGAIVLQGVGCTKEKMDCGHGIVNGIIRFHLVDDRSGLEWFSQPRQFSLDTLKKLNDQSFTQLDKSLVWSGVSLGNDYSLPETGGAKTFTYFIRLGSNDTDTIGVHVRYGAVPKNNCPSPRYAESVEVTYNGKLNGTYSPAGGFYCSGCGTILTFRKRP